MTSGSRNLMILGVGAIVASCVMTGVSLAMYRISGDIYLDRSRPGFLPDSDEATAEPTSSTTYVFAENGELTAPDLDQYLRELKNIIDRLDGVDAYAEAPLADESLGIDPDASGTLDGDL